MDNRMSDEDGSVTSVFKRVLKGDRDAAGSLWKRYFPRLRAVAHAALEGFRQRHLADADDAMQSAFMTFWGQATSGRVSSHLHRNELQGLLVCVTRCVVLKQIRRERAQKSGGGKVLLEADIRGEDGKGLDRIAQSLTAEDFDLHCTEILNQLDPVVRQVVLLRWMGHSNADIAQTLQCTVRRVERKFEVAREMLRDFLNSGCTRS